MVQAQREKVRIRFDRTFKKGTYPAMVAQYLERSAQNRTDTADALEQLICMRYLPFAISVQGSMNTRLSLDFRLVCLRSIYEFEAAIQQILALADLADPRFGDPSSLYTADDGLAQCTTPPLDPVKEGIDDDGNDDDGDDDDGDDDDGNDDDGDDDDGDDDDGNDDDGDDDPPIEGMRATVSRMTLRSNYDYT